MKNAYIVTYLYSYSSPSMLSNISAVTHVATEHLNVASADKEPNS